MSDGSEARHGPASLSPQGIVEAGGEPWNVLVTVIGRFIDDLASGQILQVVSMEPHTGVDIATWCHAAGHKLVQMRADDDDERTRFWIKKG